MKTQKITLMLAVLMLCSFMTLAQEKPEIWSWAYHTAVKGKSAELEKAIKDKTDKFNKTSVDPIYTYRVMSGPKSGQLVRVIGPKDWTYYEKDNDGVKHWNQFVVPLIDKTSGREFYVREKDMSYDGKPEGTVSNYVEVNEYTLVSAREYDFTNFVKAVTKVAAENKSKVRYETYRMTSGGSGDKYVIVWHYQSLAEKGDNSENWPAWYNKIKGSQSAWTNDLQTLSESLEIYGTNNFLCAFVPELSSK